MQTTVLRVLELPDVLPPLGVVGEEHRFITRTQIDELETGMDYAILLESVGRNTAPAICGAVEYCRRQGRDDVVLLVLPADHLIRRQDAFVAAVRKAAELAEGGAIVTFGISPTHPETGYGYIEQGDGHRVASF